MYAVERDLDREPQRPSRHGGSLYEPAPATPLPREIRAGQFSAVVREHRRPVPHGWARSYSYVVRNDGARTSADEHSGIIAVFWLSDGSPYSAAASAATSEVARRHYERRLAMAAVRSAVRSAS
jgi:hypothetical protein